MNLCKQQFHCIHYASGTSSRDHHTRDNVPCQRWLAMDCEQMEAVVILHQYTTGKPMACNIAKVKRIKEKLNASTSINKY